MTPVLHVSRPVADAFPAGLSIAPVEARDYQCPRCRASFSLPLGMTCSDHAPVCVPPDLSGRFAVAVDGAIIGTATATDVLPVLNGWDAAPGFPRRAVVAATGAPVVLVTADSDDLMTPTVLAGDPAVLGLSPGQWVVTIEDWEPTTDRCPGCWGIGQGEAVYSLSIEVGGLDYLPCDACDGEGSCPPVPVAAAPVGTITTWEAT